MNRNEHIAATLRSLDPADKHVDPVSARARADLHAILAADPTPWTQQRPPGPQSAAGFSRRNAGTTRKVVLATALVAVVTACIVVLPSLTERDRAFATWTAAPASLSAQEQQRAAAECRETYLDGQRGLPEFADELGAAAPVIAERRGAWTMVVLAGSGGFSAECITEDSARLFAKGMVGSIGTPADYVAPEPRELVARSLGVGTMSAGDFSMVAGAAGADVVGVMYQSSTHGDVIATVNEGSFALWFPGDELSDAHIAGVELQVTYRDGTTTSSRVTF